MINVRDFLKCVDMNEVSFTINDNTCSSKQLHEYYTNNELFYLKIINIYVDPNDMIMVVAEW